MAKKAKRAKEFDVEPDPAFCILAKVFDATRNKSKLSDRELYTKYLTPGEHHLVGTLNYDVQFSVGEKTQTDRFYGTPIDEILSLAFYYCGALREHFVRAAMIVKELRTAELEGKDGKPRPYQDVSFTFKQKADNKKGYVVVNRTIPAAVVAAEAKRIADKVFGDDEEESTLVQEQVADCCSKLKVKREYDGPINIVEPHITVIHPQKQAEAA